MMRAEAQASIDEARQEAERECARLLAEAKQKADDLDERARRTVEEANQQRIMILEELMDVARDLQGQGLPASLESAYQERTSPSEAALGPEESSARSRGRLVADRPLGFHRSFATCPVHLVTGN